MTKFRLSELGTTEQEEIPLTRLCGICGRVFSFLDRCIALLGTPTSAVCESTTIPFRYPNCSLYPYSIGGHVISRKGPPPSDKPPSRESATLHHDCFEVFRQQYTESDALDRLWTLSLWRVPWRGATRIFLPQKPMLGSQSIDKLALKLGLAPLAGMPPEIMLIIHSYSESATFWRLVAALDIAAVFKVAPTDELTATHALRRIAFWERGQAPDVPADKGLPPFIRFTIDAFGIKRIERLPDYEPTYPGARFDDLAFVIENQKNMGPGRVNICFKIDELKTEFTTQNGLARLSLDKRNAGFQIYDTPDLPDLPTPPALPHVRPRRLIPLSLWDPDPTYGTLQSCYSVFGVAPSYPIRCRTVDLASVTGLTFFYEPPQKLRAIHVHTHAAPFTMIPPESAFWATRDYPVCVYVPISAKDQVTALAVVAGPGLNAEDGIGCLLVCFHPSYMYTDQTMRCHLCRARWCSEPPTQAPDPRQRTTTLIYDASAHDGVSFIGALPRPQPDPSDDEIWNYDTTGRAPYDIYREYAETNFHLSSAPLRGVILAEVFQRGQRPECRGILLTYKDGSKRAVGDCRLGIDPSQRFERPDRLCVAVGGEENRRPGIPRPFYVKVRFQNGAARMKGWKTSKMEGHIHFWFTANLHYVEVISEKSSR